VRTLLGVRNCVIASCQNGTSANCAFFPAMHLQCGSLAHPNIATLTPLSTSTERPQTDCHFSPCLLHMATCLTIITPSAFAVRRHHATFEATKPMLPTRKSPVYFRDMLIYPSWYVSVPSVPTFYELYASALKLHTCDSDMHLGFLKKCDIVNYAHARQGSNRNNTLPCNLWHKVWYYRVTQNSTAQKPEVSPFEWLQRIVMEIFQAKV
jgi:hypothetical protein